MDFITRFSAKLLRLLRLSALAMLLCVTAQGHASGIESRKTSATFIGNHVELSARFNVTLTPVLEQALQNGLALPFQFEFQLNRPRFRAWARHLADWFSPEESLTQRLSYQSLTRKYRVSTGGISRSFNTLDEALSALGIISGWQILTDSDNSTDHSTFSGRIRMKLDLSQLPKPYQMGAIGQSAWHLESPWANISVANDPEAVQP